MKQTIIVCFIIYLSLMIVKSDGKSPRLVLATSDILRKEELMEVVFTHCAGLDVHKKTVVAAALLSA